MKTNMVVSRFMLILAVVLVSTPVIAGSIDDLLISGRRSLMKAVSEGDISLLDDAKAKFSEAKAAGPDLWLPSYYLALTEYRRTELSAPNSKEGGKYLDAAEKEAEVALKLTPKNPEVLAVLGAIYGFKAGRGPLDGMYYGPKGMATLEEAAKLAPDNLRVRIQNALNLYFRPAFVGGDKEKAAADLSAALEASRKSPSASSGTSPDWGLAEGYMWLGRFNMLAGNKDKARAAIKEALEIDPGYKLAKAIQKKLGENESAATRVAN